MDVCLKNVDITYDRRWESDEIMVESPREPIDIDRCEDKCLRLWVVAYNILGQGSRRSHHVEESDEARPKHRFELRIT